MPQQTALALLALLLLGSVLKSASSIPPIREAATLAHFGPLWPSLAHGRLYDTKGLHVWAHSNPAFVRRATELSRCTKNSFLAHPCTGLHLWQSREITQKYASVTKSITQPPESTISSIAAKHLSVEPQRLIGWDFDPFRYKTRRFANSGLQGPFRLQYPLDSLFRRRSHCA